MSHTELNEEIEWWKAQIRNAKKDELAFICWGIATGLMLARSIIHETKRPVRGD
jgi:hypothetical protein